MKRSRSLIWGSAIIVGGVLLLLDRVDVFPEWLLIGPVLLGVAGVALLVDQIARSPRRRGGWVGSLLMIALSAGTVTQDANLVIDTWSVWPFVVGAVVIGVPLERVASRRRQAAARKANGPGSREVVRPRAKDVGKAAEPARSAR
jgi:cell wall-active antibiotic response 4TMS protein YvqF